MTNRSRFCNQQCNNDCPIIHHPNSRMVTRVLNELYARFGTEVWDIVEHLCPNLTVCYDCRVDDFVHLEEGCAITDDIYKDE